MSEFEGWKSVENHTEVEPIPGQSANGHGSEAILEVQRADISGLPVFWGAAPGPFVAGIVFRVGRADERAPEAGITHLVEHLALPAARQKAIEFNGTVSSSTTWFWVSGKKSEALAVLREAAASISRLPARLETERGIMLTEASGRGESAAAAAAALRLGPAGHGLVGYPEFGLRWLDLDRVSGWASERFNGKNAALWMTDEPPADLDFSLPPGDRWLPPSPLPLANVRFPAVYPYSGPGGVTVTLLMKRSSAASVVASIGLERARDLLRYEHGLSYSVEMSWEPLTSEVANCVFGCDCRPGSEREAALLLRRVLEELAESGPSDRELEQQVAERTSRATDRSSLGGLAFYYAVGELFGEEFQSMHELTQEAAEVSASAAAAALREGLATALLLTGVEKWPKDDSWSLYPLFSEEKLNGRSYRPAGTSSLRKGKVKLVAGEEGVTLITANDDAVTVKFDECEVLERWPDGSRVLWAKDATRLQLDPRGWHTGSRMVSWIDEHVPADRTVSMNPAVDARVVELREELGTRLGRRRLLSRELEAASGFLDFGETPIEIFCASLPDQLFGLLLLTQRRLLFVNRGQLHADLPLHGITSVQLRGRRRRQRLAIATEEGTYVFRHLFPKRTTTDFLAALQAALEAAGSDGTILDRQSWREKIPAYASLAAFPLSLAMAVLLGFSALMLFCNGGICAAGVWLGRVGRRRAARAGEPSRAANFGMLLSIFSLLFWVPIAVLGPLTEW